MTNKIVNPVTDNVGTGIKNKSLTLVKVIERSAENEDFISTEYFSLETLGNSYEWMCENDSSGNQITWCLQDHVEHKHLAGYWTPEEMDEEDSEYLYTKRYFANESILFSERYNLLMQNISVCCMTEGSETFHQFLLVDAILVDEKLFIHHEGIIK